MNGSFQFPLNNVVCYTLVNLLLQVNFMLKIKPLPLVSCYWDLHVGVTISDLSPGIYVNVLMR